MSFQKAKKNQKKKTVHPTHQCLPTSLEFDQQQLLSTTISVHHRLQSHIQKEESFGRIDSKEIQENKKEGQVYEKKVITLKLSLSIGCVKIYPKASKKIALNQSVNNEAVICRISGTLSNCC